MIEFKGLNESTIYRLEEATLDPSHLNALKIDDKPIQLRGGSDAYFDGGDRIRIRTIKKPDKLLAPLVQGVGNTASFEFEDADHRVWKGTCRRGYQEFDRAVWLTIDMTSLKEIK
ncbi:hypothetical protein CEW46_23940 [Bacillus cereus]|nr:hypothetical protein CEW46_23940 [Bacillus cereus]